MVARDQGKDEFFIGKVGGLGRKGLICESARCSVFLMLLKLMANTAFASVASAMASRQHKLVKNTRRLL